MNRTSASTVTLAAVVIAGVTLALGTATARQQNVAVDKDDLAGVVTSAKGPEAGVWVIAETSDLPTKYAKIVVTDDRGRYLIPDMPAVKYSVWVRGYGLVDSPKVQATPGTTLNLNAVIAPNARAAAEYYPAGYWFSLMKAPPPSDFPGTGPSGNGIAPGIRSQPEWLRQMKNGTCLACHQLGNKATREIPAALGDLLVDRPGVGTAARLGSGRPEHDPVDEPDRPRALSLGPRRLDRPHQGRRGAAGPAAAAGPRAQRRHHDVGLGRSQGLPARRRLDRSPQSDAERERSALRSARVECGLRARPRSERK